MIRLKAKPLAWSVAMAIFAGQPAWAAQLGGLEIVSGADEPFRANISIEAVLPEEKASLAAGLASPEAFAAARLPVDPQLKALKFSIVPGAEAGKAVLQVTSDQPLNAGFIDALIELNWAGGQVAREYTFTIPVRSAAKPPVKVPEIAPEPIQLPAVKGEEPKPVQKPEVKPAEKVAQTAVEKPRQVPEKPVAPVEAKEAPKPKPRPATQTSGASSGDPLKVEQGDTLSELALQYVGDGVTHYQAMAAIYQANQNAFFGNSVHNLKQGAVLRVPDRAALRRSTSNESLLILANADDRNVYSLRARQLGLLGGATVAAAEPSKSSTAPAPSSSGAIESSAASPTGQQEQDRLKLSSGSAAAGSGEGDALAEELLAKNKALNEANERIALLEKNVSDLQKLIEMQGEAVEPAVAGSSGSAVEPAQEPKAPVVVEAPQVLPESPKAVEVKEPEPPANAEPAKPEPTKIEDLLARPVADPKPDAAPSALETAMENEGKEEESHASWLTSPWVLGGVGLFGLAFLILLIMKLRGRDDEEDDEEEEEGDKSESFDEALAWASTPAAAPPPVAKVQAVESEEFDLDDVLNEQEAQQPSPVEEPTVEPESIEEPEIEPESIPEGPEELEGSDREVDLEFPAETPEESGSIMDDLEDLESGAVKAQEELDALRDAGPSASEQEEHSFDDMLEAGEEDEGEAEAKKEPEPAVDFSKAVEDLDLDIPNPKLDEATWQEVATKLDLAGAYVEIGDSDGARELLNEIISRGDVDQVRKAKELLAGLD